MHVSHPPFVALLVPVVSTLAGGLLAIRFRERLQVLLALGAGVLIGAAFLDLLPESLALGALASLSRLSIFAIVLLSFAVFFLFEKAVYRLASAGERSSGGRNAAPSLLRGRIAGALLIFHSFRDGMAIGASYIASPKAGYAVALGIGAHDFGDGLNTVLLTTRGQEPTRVDYFFLIADALAPLAGGILAAWYFSSLASSAVLLAVAVGFFLQMATMDLLPELHRAAAPLRLVVPCMLAGALVIYLANLLLRFVP